MLKVKSLNMSEGLSREEALADGVAHVKIGATEVAKGVCRFKADGTNTVALIHAAGNPSAITTAFAPSAITVEVEKVLTREIVIKKDQETVDTGLGANATSAKLDGTPVDPADLSNGVITLDTPPSKDEEHTLEVTCVAARGAAEDTNVAGNALVLDAGPCYFSIIAEAIHMPGKNHSKTRCSVRGRKPWAVPGEDGPIHLS